jgi:hypothetical protein
MSKNHLVTIASFRENAKRLDAIKKEGNNLGIKKNGRCLSLWRLA